MVYISEIKIYGTSHISKESIELIDQAINEEKPDVVALELDKLRLNSLINEQKTNSKDIFIRLIQIVQNYLGKKTGVMPGDEMLHAYNKSLENGIDVALIDRDIRITIQKLKQVKRKEKVKAFASMMLSPFLTQRIDITKIPDQQLIEEMIKEVKFKYPQIHKALIEERDQHMARKLQKLKEERPNETITAFVGAGHKKGIEEQLKNNKKPVNNLRKYA